MQNRIEKSEMRFVLGCIMIHGIFFFFLKKIIKREGKMENGNW